MVGKRQHVGGADLETVFDLRLGVLDGIAGNVQPCHFESWQDLGEIVEEKAFAAAYVQHFVPGLQSIMIDHRLCDLAPAAIVMHAAITNPAVAVPIIIAPFLRSRRCLRLRITGDTAEVIPFRRLMNKGNEIDYCHSALSRAEMFSAVSPKILRAESCSHVSCRNSSLVPNRTSRPRGPD